MAYKAIPTGLLQNIPPYNGDLGSAWPSCWSCVKGSGVNQNGVAFSFENIMVADMWLVFCLFYG